MDYCHPCRRHLNGALACPGCGTPCHELPTTDERLTAGEEARPRSADGVAVDETPDEDADDAAPGARSSRRDRKAAAHRRRRRRTLLVTAGFVLAAGGLSLAELGMDAPHSPEQPAAAAGETTDSEATREVGQAPASPADHTSGRTTPSGTPSPDTSASTTASASPSSSPGTTESRTATDSAPPSASRPQPSAPADPADPEPSSPETSDDPPPTTTPTPPEPPTPTPTETCDRFLWWCT
ncbi:SCO2400 family protein [Streptomyces violaceorubidus]|uniref:Zinc ribbon domain-containing protein n=1 Tax=Streptomyces violaceorubidus TaxID=284042 RepID=A0ABV1SVV1_9ACTN